MVDRYTKIVLTVIAVMLTGLLARSLLEVPTAVAQPAACGAPANPCAVSIVGGPVAGAWQGAPIFVFDNQVEARAQARPPCGRAGDPCQAVIVGGPAGLQSWQGAPLVIFDSLRVMPRTTP